MSNPNPSPATRWKPGQSGNPRGPTPKGERLTDFLRAALEINGRRAKLADVVAKRALQGDIKFIELIFDRIDGAVAKPLELGGPGGGAIPVQHYDAAAALAVATAGSDEDPEAPGEAEGH